MTNDRRNVLDVLKTELEFLENAGYHHTARTAWRPQFMFQDSPTCLNFDRAQLAKPCSDCVLMQFIPEDLRDKKIPCRYIPLNESGETIDSFYCAGTQEEQETAVAHWLKTTIARLEREKSEGLSSEHSEVHVRRGSLLDADFRSAAALKFACFRSAQTSRPKTSHSVDTLLFIAAA